MSKTVSILLCLLVLTSQGCVSDKATREPSQAAPSEQNTATILPSVPKIDRETFAEKYPRIDGSTSAQPLQVHLACTILKIPCSWQEGWIIDQLTRRIVPDPGYEGSPRLIEHLFNIQHSGTHGAYTNLIQGKTDFILVARSPSDDELREAQNRGVELDVKPVALDAFVFLVNASNPVMELPLESIRHIYTGEIKQWQKVGSEIQSSVGGEIHTYQRNRNSGSQELMEKLVMRGEAMIDSPEMILESMIGPINAIKEDPLGIGYSVYFYAEYILPDENVRLLGVDGVLPNSENIENREYPLTTEVFAVIRQEMPSDHSAFQLRDWLLTEEGQQAIAGSGYVPFYSWD